MSTQITIPESFDSIKEHNLYLYVKYYLSSLRNNSAHVKNRGDVRGGGKKPWAQKGGGRARAGSLTSPVFVGGGVSHGPSNGKNYSLKINKKQKKAALNFALNQKYKSQRLHVVDKVDISSGKTKDAVKYFTSFGERDILFIGSGLSDTTLRAFRNLKECYVIEKHEINAYLVATFRAVVIEKDVLDALVSSEG